MKSLWKAILNGLTFVDLAGHRQPRAYAVIALCILILLGLVGGFALHNHFDLMRKVSETAQPVAVISESPTQTATPIPETTSTDCPADAQDWSLVDVVVSTNYQLIQPACVYAGLEKTIAWALAVREGYSRAEATSALGFVEMPMRPLDRVKIPSKDQGAQEIAVSFIPANPDFTEWHINTKEEPAVTYALRGCFRTSSVVGNRLEVWGGNYPVVCLVAEDAEHTNIVYQLEGHSYTISAKPTRSFLLFGYAGNNLWIWLGTQDDPKIAIDDPVKYANDRQTVATLYDSKPWDARWLQTQFQLTMKSLPENWQSFTDESEKQAILQILNTSVSETKP